ncbi:hypothetical protein [Lichenibacterium ramalinae]|uniref:hypothetical protein n=1 Tax=Lichenibacterium ramalinae TaxID=2316527 RepID=UPI0013EADBAF|nr:hypothetical protein [Lichenibacterium ramalinae]
MSHSVTHLRDSGQRPRRMAATGPTALGILQDQGFIVLLALVMTGLPVALNFLGQNLAVGICLTLAIVVALRFERAVPTVLIVCYIFQTTFVSYASAYVADVRSLDPMKSYNFVTTVGVWIVLAVRFVHLFGTTSPFVRRLTLWSAVALAVAVCYYVPGLLYDARGATIYLRNIVLPLMLFQICVNVGSRHPFHLDTVVVLILTTLLACGYFELFFIERWLDLTHGWSYLDLGFADRRASPMTVREAKETGAVVGTALDLLKTNLLNSNLLGDLGTVTRIQGPNFHPISYGYVLSTMAALAAVQGYWLLIAAAVPLMIVVGAKGAIVLLVASVAFVAAARVSPSPATLWAFVGIMSVYAVLVFRSGIAAGDYHVLGLLGGLSGFVGNPLGHTLGQGGNLSVAFAEIDFQKYQKAGQSDLAVESAIGVLLYQMGVCGFGLLAVYGWISALCWRLFRHFRLPSLALATALIVVTLFNGLFQEEAMFAPLALGLVMLVVGLTLGAVDRRIAPLVAPLSTPLSRPLSDRRRSAPAVGP